MTSDTYSPTYLKPFAIFDQDTQSLKMFEDTLVWDSTPFSATLPASGMMRNGVLFELPKQEQLIAEQDCLLLPTPLTTDGKGTAPADARRNTPPLRAARWYDFRKYQAALDRWAKVIGRPAPNPLTGKKLNPEFVEFLMGLPKGWVTDVEITSEQKIKACGNGVVPQQAKLALERLIP